MRFNFVINEDFLFVNTLVKAHGKGIPFSSWVGLQNRVWEKHKAAYKVLKEMRGTFLLSDTPKEELRKIIGPEIRDLVEDGKQSKEFKKVLLETQDHLKFVKNEWNKKGKRAQEALKNILGITLPEEPFTVFITHPKVGNGRYIEPGKIIWGHEEDWPNYSIVYLLHEALHRFLKEGRYTHEIIELATDNELRIRLNGSGEYFKEGALEVGHSNLRETEKKLLPIWQKYLADKTQDIHQFLLSLE